MLQQAIVDYSRRMYSIAKNISAEIKGSLEVWLSPSLLRYEMIIIDSEITNAKIYLKIYRHTQSSSCPVVQIRKERNPKWLELFYDQTKAIWDICEDNSEIFIKDDFDRLRDLLLTKKSNKEVSR